MRISMLALAAPLLAMGLALQSCTPPPAATLSIVNNSGQRVSLVTCRGETVVIEPGSGAELTDRYFFSSPVVNWGCFRKKGFVLRTAGGAEWRYAAWDRRAKGAPKDRRPSLWAFSAASRDRPGRGNGLDVEIEADGSIRAGRRVASSGGEALQYRREFSADDQPRGFPLIPQR